MNYDQRSTAPRDLAYEPHTPWGPWGALLGGVGITLAALAATVATVAVIQKFGDQRAIAAQGWLVMIAFQAVIALGAWWLAGWFGGVRARVLSLAATWPSMKDMAILLSVFLSFTLPYTWAVYIFRPEVLIADNAQFASLMRSAEWPVYAFIIAIGAPISEEFLFRGFMLPALARSRIGFFGAAVITTLLWMALHFTYSIFGLIEIVMIGLLLSWAVRKTGSLWAPIAIHAINNGFLAFAMKYQLLPWT